MKFFSQQYTSKEPPVLWHCWLGVRKSIWPVKSEWWGGYLSETRCKWCAYGPADATATSSSLASLKSRFVLQFWWLLIQAVLEKRRLNRCLSVWKAQTVLPQVWVVLEETVWPGGQFALSIQRHGHPASINYQLIAMRVVTYDPGRDLHRNVVQRTGTGCDLLNIWHVQTTHTYTANCTDNSHYHYIHAYILIYIAPKSYK